MDSNTKDMVVALPGISGTRVGRVIGAEVDPCQLLR
jgi:hypothetical protein